MKVYHIHIFAENFPDPSRGYFNIFDSSNMLFTKPYKKPIYNIRPNFPDVFSAKFKKIAMIPKNFMNFKINRKKFVNFLRVPKVVDLPHHTRVVFFFWNLPNSLKNC